MKKAANGEEQPEDDKLMVTQKILKQEIEQRIAEVRTWKNMRILWHSVAPYINSGYGTVTRYFMSGLLNRGFAGFVSAYYGLQPGGMINWKGIYVLPVHKTQSDQLGFMSTIEHYKRFQCDLGIFHADFWVSYPFAKKIPYTLCYSPIDHEQYPDKWLEVLRAYKWVATPSLHAQKELKRTGIESTFIPHGVNTKAYFPLDKELSRKAFTLEKDKFIIGIVAANNDEECFDSKTELLTKEGWKGHKEIKSTDLIASLNEEGFLEYQQPLRIVKYPGKHRMHLLQTKYLDFYTTSGHEHYVQAFNNRQEEGRSAFRKETSAEIFGKRRCFLKTAKWRGERVESLEISKGLRVEAHALMKLIGFYLSEGNVNKETCFISQTEGWKKDQMLLDLRTLPFKVGESKGKLYICNVKLASYLKRFGQGAANKHLTPDILELDTEYLETLWHALVLGDGWKHCNSEEYATISKKLVDDLQELLLKIGSWGSIKKRVMKEGKIAGRRIIPRHKYIYSIRRNSVLSSVENRTNKKGSMFREEWLEYSGLVWCVEVSNHLVYARRNGKACWTGQTRKAWDANFLAIKYFFEQNPDAVKDTQVFIHTDPENERGRNLVELARQIGIEKSIIWNDRYTASLLTLPDSAMCKLYNCFDVFLLLSRREGFCIPALEAQACGIPCILNDFSALTERNDYGKCGWLVRPATYVYSPLNAKTSIPDPHKGADALTEAYNNESKRKMFAKRSLAYARRQTWDIAIDKHMLPLLEKIGEEIPHLSTKKGEEKEWKKLAKKNTK